jgi:xanthine dehydrogenase accessory factor
MADIFEEIVKLRREGKRAVLATIISVKGSTPRKEGTKMLIKSDGAMLGSIGGGSIEAEVCQEAKRIMDKGKAEILHFDLTGKAAEEGMICGGVMDIFVEPILSPSTLYIFGGGHISLPLTKMGKMVGFNIVVIDDRSDFANPERFPDADEVFAQDFPEVFPKLKVTESSYIVIVTWGHLSDEAVLEWAVKTDAKYIGMIGSKKKNEAIFSHLRSKGIPRDLLQKVHAPIGLDIGAETPEEIAVSILAELIKTRREL